MGTQGLVTIMWGDDVACKAVAGCCGDAAEKLADLIREAQPRGIQAVHTLAGIAGFGCEDCLVVYNAEKSYPEDALADLDEETRQRYLDTFDRQDWNPRVEDGVVSEVEIVRLPMSKLSRLSAECGEAVGKIEKQLAELKALHEALGVTDTESALDRLTYLNEEVERVGRELAWHETYVRPPDDPNNPRPIAAVFIELDNLRKACRRLERDVGDLRTAQHVRCPLCGRYNLRHVECDHCPVMVEK